MGNDAIGAEGYVEIAVTHAELVVEYRIVYAKDPEALVKYCKKRGLLTAYCTLVGEEYVGVSQAEQSEGDPISGFTVSHTYHTVSDDGKRGVIYLLVTRQERCEELRTWAHEISHAADFTVGILAKVHPGVSGKMMGELKATCAELLADSVRILTTGNLRTETPMSQFPGTLARALKSAHVAPETGEKDGHQ